MAWQTQEMKWSRDELAEGLSLIGCLGIMIGAIVIPGQLLEGSVRDEAEIGAACSVVLLAGSVVAAKGTHRLLHDLSGTALVVGIVYFVAFVRLVFDPQAWRLGHMLGYLAAASFMTLAGWYGLQRFPSIQEVK